MEPISKTIANIKREVDFHLELSRLSALTQLLMRYPYNPFHWIKCLKHIPSLPQAPQADLSKYLLNQIQSFIKDNALIKTYSNNHQLLGLCIINQDRWDSEQLGFKVLKIPYLIAFGSNSGQQNIKSALLRQAISDCLKQCREVPQAPSGRQAVYIFTRMPDADATSINALQEMEFMPVDSLITFAQVLKAHPSPASGSSSKVVVVNCSEEDLTSVMNIAFDSFIFDRFHSDRSIPKAAADKVYSTWLKNSYQRGEILVAKTNDKIAGFIAHRIQTIPYLDLKIGIIDLVATHNNFRNLGIAKSLVTASLNYFSNQSVDIAKVGTQAANLPAIRLYQSCGFQIATSSISLRKWVLVEPESEQDPTRKGHSGTASWNSSTCL